MDLIFAEYDIIKYLKSKSHSFYTTIERLYTACQDLLLEIPKTFSNYTLHDIGHSIRVVGYMNDLVKHHLGDFSELHLAMIVYVGLLHDTGMVVFDDERRELYDRFERRIPSFKIFSEDEKTAYLQNYIRKNHAQRVRVVLNHKINGDTSIQSYLYAGETRSYDLSKIVAEICQSHTEDCAWIEKNLDSELHYENYKINPQHIALLLRIGDALDIDDRRAPYMLYHLLNPQGYSDGEWRKHIPITNYNKISFNGSLYEITFSGECSEPEIYRKIKEYIDWFESDLNQANSICCLKDEYKLNIKVPVHVNIKTKGFIETSLRFNLEYVQIVQLLMGENIYGSKQDGLRELLQNSIDAVLLMQDIESKNPYSTYSPLVGIEINEKDHQLIVFDNGTGMSEEILQKYFFNIGSSYYVSDEFNSDEHMYKPIGHFGIGFLACFMLSSNIKIETRYYLNRETTCMSFSKESPYVTKFTDSFPAFHLEHGTRIIMNYNQIVPGVFQTNEKIIEYIKNLLITNRYKFWFIHNEKTEILLQGPQNRYTIKSDIIELEYTVKPRLNVKFNMVEFFEDREDVYIVDSIGTYRGGYDEKYVNLAFLAEIIRHAEIRAQTEKYDLEGDWNFVDFLDENGIPSIFIKYIEESLPAYNRHDMSKNEFYFACMKNLSDYLYDYLYGFINNGSLIWYDIPVILHKQIFNNFLNMYEDEGIERARQFYKSDIQYVSILCKEESLLDKSVLDIVQRFIYSNATYDFSWETTDVSYYTTYPVPPIKKSIKLLGYEETRSFLRVVKNSHSNIPRVYLKGIRVRDENIVIPYSIQGVDITDIYVNVVSGNYGTDISRENFDAISREKINRRIACIIYEDILTKKWLKNGEAELVKLFLDTYYSDE